MNLPPNYSDHFPTSKGVLLFIIGVCGIFCNTAAIFVLKRKRRYQRNFHALMMCLAVFDLCYICLAMTIFSLKEFSEGYANGLWYVIIPYAIPLIQISLTGSIYCTMAITLERYLAVCRPFYRITRDWSSRIFVVPIILISVIYNLPQFFEIQTCEIRTKYIPNNDVAFQNITYYCPGSIFEDSSTTISVVEHIQLQGNKTEDFREVYLDFTKLRSDKSYQVYRTISLFLINAAVPFVFIFILNAKILRGLTNRYMPTNGGTNGTSNNDAGKSTTLK